MVAKTLEVTPHATADRFGAGAQGDDRQWEVSGVGDCVPPCWLESFVRVVFGQPWCSRSGNPVTVLEPLGMLLGPLK